MVPWYVYHGTYTCTYNYNIISKTVHVYQMVPYMVHMYVPWYEYTAAS
jgi:hypothetical protein